MKTIVTKKIISDIDGLGFGYWDHVEEKFVPISEGAANLELIAEKLGCSADLLNAIAIFAEFIRQRVGGDLASIWERLDKMETGWDIMLRDSQCQRLEKGFRKALK